MPSPSTGDEPWPRGFEPSSTSVTSGREGLAHFSLSHDERWITLSAA